MKKLLTTGIVTGLLLVLTGCPNNSKPGPIREQSRAGKVSIQVVDFLGAGELQECVTLTIGNCQGTFNISRLMGQQTLVFDLPSAGVYNYSAQGRSVKDAGNGQQFNEVGFGQGQVNVQPGLRYQIFQILHPNGGYRIELRQAN